MAILNATTARRIDTSRAALLPRWGEVHPPRVGTELRGREIEREGDRDREGEEEVEGEGEGERESAPALGRGPPP